jgi:hypothetical protein
MLELKRLYDPKDLERFLAERDATQAAIEAKLAGILAPDAAAEAAKREAGRQVSPARVTGIEVRTAPAPGQRHHFTPGLLDRGMAEGWLSVSRGVITLHAAEGDLAFRILRAPGHYCCHCGVPIEHGGAWVDEAKTQTKGQAHVATAHPKTTSPDPANPAGYERINYYHTERLAPATVEG